MNRAALVAAIAVTLASGAVDAAHLNAVTAYQPTKTENGIVVVPVLLLVSGSMDAALGQLGDYRVQEIPIFRGIGVQQTALR